MDHQEWDEFLKAHVRSGLADYKRMLQDRATLDQYLARMAEVPLETLGEASREERIAFWINLYNASVIRTILDAYPVGGIDDIPAVWDIRTVHVIREYLSLADLRDHVLREGFREERVLTAISSARMDSPALYPEAFRGGSLEEQLDRAARAFVEDEAKNRIVPEEKTVFLSPVFREFGGDFVLNFGTREPAKGLTKEETAVIGFFLHHLRDPKKRIFLDGGRYQVKYLPEDPRLNEEIGAA